MLASLARGGPKGHIRLMKDTIVAISGAAGGLGPTVARAFADAGAALAVAGRSLDKLRELLAELKLAEARSLATALNLTEAGAAREWARKIGERFGRIDVLVHLVGGYRGGTPLADAPMEDWDFLHESLVLTTLNVVQAFAGPLKAGGRGRFIGVTSVKARSPSAKGALYAAAKAASDALVLALADELKGSGATANLIVVDSIDAPGKAYGKSTAGRDIAAAMLFLCSEEAAAINGVHLPLIGRGL